MGVVIKATQIIHQPEAKSAIQLAADAADLCIETSQLDRNDIDLLIYTGVYRDKNISEPAIAPLVQHRLGMNLLYTNRQKTFSFDIGNGPCGFLTAVKVCESLLQTAAISSALIISCDIHPSGEKKPDFPYTPVGAAVLLGYSEDPQQGFQTIDFKTSTDPNHQGLKGYLDFRDCGTDGQNHISIDFEEDYIDRLLDLMPEAFELFAPQWKICNLKVGTDPIKYTTSAPIPGFGRKAVERLIPGPHNQHPVPCYYEKFGDSHSSGLAVAYHQSVLDGYIQSGDRVLFIGAGSGLTIACGLYNEP